jgi:hypothetical protein
MASKRTTPNGGAKAVFTSCQQLARISGLDSAQAAKTRAHLPDLQSDACRIKLAEGSPAAAPMQKTTGPGAAAADSQPPLYRRVAGHCVHGQDGDRLAVHVPRLFAALAASKLRVEGRRLVAVSARLSRPGVSLVPDGARGLRAG